MSRHACLVLAALLAVISLNAGAGSLDADIAQFKGQVADLNRDLFKLEEDILHPANTQLAVYLSVEAQNYFTLDSVELSIDGRSAVSHLYSEQERQALNKGGIQRLYVGNLAAGHSPHYCNAEWSGCQRPLFPQGRKLFRAQGQRRQPGATGHQRRRAVL